MAKKSFVLTEDAKKNLDQSYPFIHLTIVIIAEKFHS